MQTNRLLWRWVTVGSAATLVAIGCATTNEEPETPVTDSGKPDTKKPDTSVVVPDTSVEEDSGTIAEDTSTPVDANDAGGNKAGEPFDPTAPAEGSTCSIEFDVVSRRCGACGQQQALCTKQSDGTLKLAAYGTCVNESAAPDACLPNAERNGPSCGLCGKMLQQCDPDLCKWSDIACENEVQNGCTEGEVRYLQLNCPSGQFSKQTCGSTCSWSAPDACAARVPDVLTLPAQIGYSASQSVKLWSDAPSQLGVGACPTTLTGTPGNIHYATIHNPESTPLAIDLWQSKALGGANLDTILAVYSGTTMPAQPAERQACVGTVNDQCSTSPCMTDSASKWGGFVGAAAVTIPANGDILVYSAGKSNALSDAPFVLNARRSVGSGTYPTTLAVPTAGQTYQGNYTLVGTGPKMKRASSGTCPASIASSTYQYAWITITNSEAVDAKINVGADSIGDLMMAAYPTAPNDATVNACLGTSADFCSLTGFTNDACVPNLTIPANGQIVVMVSNYSPSVTSDVNFSLKITRL